MPRVADVPRILVSAPASGAGKTTFTLGLLDALATRGLSVQPYKAGPDFIDASHHRGACGRPSRNLDTWMCGEAAVREVFLRAAAGADICVIEGVMGLYDGFGAGDDRGSTAHLAKLLDCPVLMVIDAQRSATSAAAVALGFREFDPALRLAGVAFNNVGGEGHYEWLRSALETRAGLASFGYLRFDPAFAIEERHLGLVPADESDAQRRIGGPLREQFAAHVHLDRILAAAGEAPPLEAAAECVFRQRPSARRVRIGVARDEAINFYYQDNLDLLELAGAQLVTFSLLRDAALPPGLHGLYLGGGFPEMFAPRLAANRSMLAALRDFHARGGSLYAECGGLMVLCDAIVDFAGTRHAMAGLVPATAVMRRDRLSLGYCEVQPLVDTLLAPAGRRYRAQTFHHSVLEGAAFAPAHTIHHGDRKTPDGYADDRLLATYVHAYFPACPPLAHRLVGQFAKGEPV